MRITLLARLIIPALIICGCDRVSEEPPPNGELVSRTVDDAVLPVSLQPVLHQSLSITVTGRGELLPEQPFAWEERPLQEATSVSELALYTADGMPISDFAGTVVFLSPHCPGCSEWLEAGRLDEIEEPVLIVFPASQYELGIEKYQRYWDGRDSVAVALQLGVSPYRVRFPSTVRLTADG